MVAFALLAPAGAPPPAPEGASAGPAAGFEESVVLSGLSNPTVVRFARDGRIFVAEKSGLIKVFDSLSDPGPTTFADLRTQVHNFWDRGLLGMALHPNFPATPYVYVLYTYDHVLGDPASPPRWGSPGTTSDPCPTPPGPTTDGCVASARLSRLQASGDVMTGPEQVLVEDWCQQYPSHSVGTVEFGPDGALYAGAGDGASFNFADYGQDGSPLNPCGDPPGGVGASLSPPSAEGGALRSQDLRTTGDPTTLDGTIIRVDPATGAGLPTNPLAGSADPNARRIVAHGLRNPFRFSFRPGTSEIWLGDVGWTEWEEINRILDPADGTVENFGWPCYEGPNRQSGYDSLDLNLCESLYATPNADTKPFFSYHHSNKIVAGETCPAGSSSVAGLAFEFAPGGSAYPQAYQGALFFADYSRDCIWVMKKGGNPVPSPGQIETFVSGAANPVNLEFGPDGNLYYPDFDGGTIRRISATGVARADLARGRPASASSSEGAAYLPGNAVDGDSFTRWSSAFSDSQWWQVDLGSVRSVSEVRLNWETAYASRYQILTSQDGQSFTLAAEQQATSPGWLSTVFPERGARYVRVLGLTRATPWGFSFWDAEVFGPVSGAPVNSSPPTISGTPEEGQTLTAAAGTWSGTAPIAYAYQWRRCDSSGAGCADIQGANAQSYVLGAADVGSRLRVRVTASNTVGSASADSAPTAVVTGSANTPPSAQIDTPTSTLTWKVGDTILFSGRASDAEQGELPASALAWRLLLQHCPSNCHTHTLQTWDAVASGSFQTPDHESPSHLELELTATDAAGTSDATSVRLDPQTVTLTFESEPAGLSLAVNASSQTTPFTRTVILGSSNSLSAPSPQTSNGTSYAFSSWSDGGAQAHNVTAPAGGATYRATYVPAATTCSTGEFLASYFANRDLAGSSVLTRCESAIDYQWGSGSPGPSVPADDFSA
ncbi:MAG TPA: PQQ-dependent sugar dehydrogenase, partial [Gaiellaceae bacterium]|nr:PQQ-dependent sugar dehydrogenase [Gaiellaceae bacterium]